MPEKILELAHRSTLLLQRKGADPAQLVADELKEVFRILNTRTGHDFSAYKASTIIRRIERRMAVNDISDIKDYIKLLKDKPDEDKALFKEFLIGVTSFFRDPEAFESLEQQVLPQLFKDRDPDEPLRVWLAGCATGEEAYSVAILLREFARQHRIDLKAQIFATDIDEEAVDFARAGLYPDSIGADLPPERLRTFFQTNDSSYQVVKSLREPIVFAQHNLIKDPPFSRLDLLICRNLLIYLNPELQRRILPLFAHSLKPGGFLFLGSSETVGGYTDLFQPLDKKWKIFQRRETGRPVGLEFPMSTMRSPMPVEEPVRSFQEAGISPGALAEKALMQRYSPPCVMINEKLDVVYYSTRTHRYLEPPVGEPTQNILKMVRPDLRPALRAAVHKALAEQEPAVYKDLRIATDGGEETLDLRVEPVTSPPSAKGLAMVIFEQTGMVQHSLPPQPEEQASPVVVDESSRELIIKQLEEQLLITNEQLQSNIERMESTNEELKSTNEELMSMNEEFQSTNEELETSKEELQALNEELVTVNAELQNKLEELAQTNNVLQNFLSSTDIATIFLDRQFLVKRFSPAMAKLFNLIPADLGRPLQHFTRVLNYPELQHDVQQVLETLRPVEREMSDPSRRHHYLVRVLPYRTMEGNIDGVVVTFIDITERKQMEDALQREKSLLATIMQTTDVMLVYFDAEFNFVAVNQAYADTCNMKPEQLVGKNHFVLFPDKENETIFKRVRDTGEAVFFKDKPFSFPDQPERGVTYWDWSLAPVPGPDKKTAGLVFSLRETTQYKLMELALEDSEARFRSFMDNSPAIAWIKDEDGRIVYLSKCYENRFGVRLEDWRGKTDFDVWPPEIAEEFTKNDRTVLETGEPIEVEEVTLEPGGRKRFWLNCKFPIQGSLQRSYVGGIGFDITKRKETEETLRQSEYFIRTVLDSVEEGIIVVDRDFKIISANKPFCAQVQKKHDDIIGKTCHEMVHNFDKPCFEHGEHCAIQEVFRTGLPQTFVHTHDREDGDAMLVETKAYPLRNAEGEIVSAIESITNITQKHQLEEERLKAQKLESIGTLAGGIAHDFNNLLQGVFGYINIAKMAYDNKDRCLAMLSEADAALMQARSLTTQLLTFSKGGKPVKGQTLLLPAIKSSVRLALSGSVTDYQLECAEEPWPVEADEGQIMQVFQNIVINAREAMAGTGTVLITIDNVLLAPDEITALPNGGRFVRIRFKDSGPGVSERDLPRIFDPYFTTKEQGSGLGLATVFSIVRNHGGTITAQSEPDVETSFTVYLPASEAPAGDSSPDLKVIKIDKKGRILVMDDEKMVCEVASQLLRELGHEVECVADGQVAIDRYRSSLEAGEAFDIIILDITVKGGMGGEEALVGLRQLNPGVVTVVSSGYADNNIIATFKDHGFSAVLAKPYNIVTLDQCIQSLLK